MKKFRKIMAILVAAVMIVAMAVPAWAAGEHEASGRLESDFGTITIANPKVGETYSAYKIFDLASFKDNDNQTTVHTGDESATGQDAATEWYSYVIRQYYGDENAVTPKTNPWWTFVTTQGYKTADGNEWKYAVEDRVKGESESGEDFAAYTAERNHAYFLYSKEPVTLSRRIADGTGNTVRVEEHTDYHIIKKNPDFASFSNEYDDPESEPTVREDIDNGDTAGGKKGIDFFLDNNKIIQNFAQEALKYATETANPKIDDSNSEFYRSMLATVDNIAGGLKLVRQDLDEDDNTTRNDNANLGYYLVGSTMGTLAALDTTNVNVVMYEKNDEPELAKAVLKKGAEPFSATPADWVHNTDANAEDYIQFRTVITAEQGMKNYTLHDVMEEGLTFQKGAYVAAGESANPYGWKVVLERDVTNNGETTTDTYDIPASFEEVEISSTTYTGTNFTFEETATNLTDGCDFEIAFQDCYTEKNATYDVTVNLLGMKDGTTPTMLDVKDNDRIVVYYYAKLDGSKAEIWGTGKAAAGDKTTIKDHQSTPATLDDKYQVLNRNYNNNQRNDNFTILTYGERSNTVMRSASVTTYQFDIAKTRDDAKGTTKYSLLEGAKFKLYKVTSTEPTASSPNKAYNPAANASQEGYYITKTVNGVTYYVLKTDGSTGAGNAMVFSKSDKYLYSGNAVVSANASTQVDTLESVSNAFMNVKGVEAGTYLLEEIEAPLGYDKLAYPIVITIAGDKNYNGVFQDDDPLEGTISTVTVKNNGDSETFNNIGAIAELVDGTKYESSSSQILPKPSDADALTDSSVQKAGIKVINKTGEELPSTGGMGTTVLYIVGGMMVLLAGAYLLFSRKRTA